MKTFIAALLILTFGSAAVASDNWVGSWVLDTARSKYTPGPLPRSVNLKYEATAGGVKVINLTVDVQGKSVERTATFKFDGKDYPYLNNVNADMVSGRRISDRSFETKWKKAGKSTLTQRITVSSDSQTLTITQTGKDAEGNAVHNLGVYVPAPKQR